ncbi:hypothetical protein JTE90_004970 [Oedothorax gibbosus]|uniref:Uncharacterized protein n=1 Tax=Oedothorax gibbosus TaxID=931172 RepID=A0AAV6VFY1_9ARAC|nr:hypothetical protein JTE90_004970 [Oedothorax gibbosus]
MRNMSVPRSSPGRMYWLVIWQHITNRQTFSATSPASCLCLWHLAATNREATSGTYTTLSLSMGYHGTNLAKYVCPVDDLYPLCMCEVSGDIHNTKKL